MPTRLASTVDSLVLRASRVRMRWVILVLLAGALIQGYWVNIDPARTEQSAFLAYSTALFDSNYGFVGDRCRMPLFPLLLSACGWLKADDWFYSGKAVAGLIAAAVAAGLFAWLRRLFGKREGAIVWVALWGGALALRTFYVQSDVLACGLVLLSWALARDRDAGLLRVSLAGMAAGAAVLSRFSMIPFLVIVAGMLAAAPGGKRWKFGAARAAAFTAFSAIPLFRYLSNSRAQYGRWFYNVNSSFYVWYDNWSQVASGTRAFGDRDGWPRMPAGDIPSLHWYLSRHGIGAVASRLLEGGAIQLGVLLLFCGLFLWIRPFSRLRPGMVRSPRDWAVVLLALVYFALASWWTALGIGSRFMLPIVPVVIVEAWAKARDSADAERLYGCAVLWFLCVWPFLALFSFAGE